MKIVARHKWLYGCTITESQSEDTGNLCPDDLAANVTVRFTATIRKWRNWKIYEGRYVDGIAQKVMETVRQIRDQIDIGNESVYYHKGYWIR